MTVRKFFLIVMIGKIKLTSSSDDYRRGNTGLVKQKHDLMIEPFKMSACCR